MASSPASPRCSSTSGIARARRASGGEQNLRFANADALLSFDGSAALEDDGDTVGSPGRRAGGAAPAGVDWDHGSRSWEVDGYRTVVVGGTAHQYGSIGRTRHLVCDLSLCGICFLFSDEWLENSLAYEDPGDGLIAAVSSNPHDGSGWSTIGEAPVTALYPAVTWFGHDRVLVAGGRIEGSGSDGLYLIDADDASSISSTSGTAMGNR